MKKTKIIVPIIFVLVLILTIISGCFYPDPDNFPIETLKPSVSHLYENVHLKGAVGVPFCLAKNHTFVYDTESHENWEDYAFRDYDEHSPPDDPRFYAKLGFSEVNHNVTYYVRAVAYCYDFKKPFEDYKEGYYQGRDKTFIID